MTRRASGGPPELPAQALVAEAVAALRGTRKIFLVKAPPGSGKTTLLLGVLRDLLANGRRLAVGTQTNSQADDLCERWIRYGLGPITRLVSSGDDRTRADAIQVCRTADELPHGPCVVVANTKKWAWTRDMDPFDVLLVDEAWQMSWAEFAALPHLAASFMLIGDPGQIQPIVSVDTSRWETAPVGPHRPAPEVLLARGLGKTAAIDQTYRLPHDTADLVGSFYDFPFAAHAKPGDRRLLVEPGARGPLADVVARAREASIVAATRPLPACGTVPDDDPEIAFDVAQIVRRLVQAKGEIEIDGRREPIDPSKIGVVATHRVMLSSIRDRLEDLAASVTLETPERWQGLQRPIMVAVHPLSSMTDPSAFDLATGRLCVMASRHQVSLFVVSRSHIAETLAANLPEAAQAPSQRDEIGRGHARHSEFWQAIDGEGRSVLLG